MSSLNNPSVDMEELKRFINDSNINPDNINELISKSRSIVNIYRHYQDNFKQFIIDVFYREFLEPDGTIMFEDFQMEWISIIDSAVKNYKQGINKGGLRLSVLTCKGAGKTTMLMLTLLWGCMCWDDPKLKAMSNTKTQTVSVLMQTCKTLIQNAGLSNYFELAKESIRMKDIYGKDWDFNSIDIQVPNIRNLESLSGIHSKQLSICVIDEATSITDDVINKISGIFSSGLSILILSGNASDKTGSSEFYKIMTSKNYKEDWYKLIAPYNVMKRSTYNKEAMDQTYRDSESRNNYLLCKFTLNTEQSYLPPDITRMAFNLENKKYYEDLVYLSEDVILGIDVAYGAGQDYSCIVARYKRQAKILFYSNTTSLDDFVTIIESYVQNKPKVVIDFSGVGRVIRTQLLDRGVKNIIDITLQSKARNPECYFNKKSEMLQAFKFWVMDGDTFIETQSSFQQKEIITQALSIPVEIKEDGRYNLGNKALMKKSPDLIDALSYTFPFDSP